MNKFQAKKAGLERRKRRVRGKVTGTAVISTSTGMMCDRDARKQGIGGEVIAYVW